MEKNTNIAIIYPLVNKNAPDTTIVWVSEFARIFEELFQQLFGRKLDISIKSFSPAEEDTNLLIGEGLGNYDYVFPLLSSETLKNTGFTEFLKTLVVRSSVENILPFRINLIARKPVVNDFREDWLFKFPIYNIFEKSSGIKGFKAIDFSQKIPEDSPVWEKLIDLAFDIFNQLIRSGTEDNRIKVFLAETTSDQELYHDKIKRELIHSGFKVLPTSPLPLNHDDLKEELERIVKQCDISIHIMGGIYGDYIKSGAYSLIDFQNRVVREVNNSEPNNPVQRIIWIPPYLRIPDQRQELYLRRLRREETVENTEIIQAPLEDLKNLLSLKIREKTKKAGTKVRSNKSIYLIHDYYDKDAMDEIKGVLGYHQIEVLQLDYSLDNIVEAHYQNLIDCDGVLIYYNGIKNWVNSKLSDLKKVWGYGRKKPFRVKAVLLEDKAYNEMFSLDLGDVIKIVKQQDMLDKSLQPMINLINN